MAGTEIDGDSERLLDDDQTDVERQRAVGLVGGLPRCCDKVFIRSRRVRRTRGRLLRGTFGLSG